MDGRWANKTHKIVVLSGAHCQLITISDCATWADELVRLVCVAAITYRNVNLLILFRQGMECAG